MNAIRSRLMVRIASAARTRITSPPTITGFEPKRSSSRPLISAPIAPVIVSRIPNSPISIVDQPNVPAA